VAVTIVRKARGKWTLDDMVGMAALAPLAVDYVPWTAWSMRPAAIASIVTEIDAKRRTSVVEIGAGTSTPFLARAVARNGGQLVAIEHDPAFGEYLNRILTRNGLQSTARVEIVPLEPLPTGLLDESPHWTLPDQWYDLERVRKVCPPEVDALVVDGPPPGRDDVLSRDPALAALAGNLAPSYSVFLDDIDRPAEQETVRRWEHRLGITMYVIERIALAVGTPDDGLVLTL
jgi:hypothetical protein